MPPKTVERLSGPLRFHSLYLWTKDSPRALPYLVRALKNSTERDWLIFAEHFAQRIIIPKNIALVPSPARVWKSQDHAWCWAKALATVTGAELRSPLVRINCLQQKTLSRAHRAEFRVECIDPQWNCSDYTSVIIVDDVVTTGSTAKGCYLALGRPKICQVWALIDRAPCGASAALI